MWARLLIATALGADALSGAGRARAGKAALRLRATAATPAPFGTAAEGLPFNAKIQTPHQTRFCAILSFLVYNFTPMPNDKWKFKPAKEGFEFEKGRGPLVSDLLDPKNGFLSHHTPPPPKRSGLFGDLFGKLWRATGLGHPQDAAADAFQDTAVDFRQFESPDPEMRLLYLGNKDKDTFMIIVDCPTSNDIVVAFRGTDMTSIQNDEADLDTKKVAWTLDSTEVNVHEGYYDQFAATKKVIDKKVGRVIEAFPERRLMITGHSMGGAISSIVGAYLSVEYPENKVRVVNYGSPRVGDQAFKDFVESRANLRHTRCIFHNDVVPRMFWNGYKHAGHLVYFSPDQDEPDVYPFNKGTPWWMYMLPPVQFLTVSDHSSQGYVQSSEDWAAL